MALVPQDITDISYIISERFEKVNTEYIKRMAEHIKYLGKLKPSDMHELEIMARMSVDTKEINEMLAKETGLAINDIYKVYDESGLRAYQDTSVYYEAKGITQIPFSENANMQAYMNSIKEATANTFVNMANTTVIDNTYKTAIDNAIQIISSGYADNNARLRRVIKDNVAGARVTYKSGVTRRLDSACRMNILDGARRINRGIRKIAGQEFGADGVEIDAHGLCAEDHLDIQGKQYSIKKYELLNSNLKREIGTCNCGHNITYIILGVSKPAWDDDDLKQARQYSTDKVEFKGKEMTRYEASQKMRQMETAMRYKKDEIIGLKTAGYDVAKEEKQLRAIQSNYRQLCNVAELKPRYERAYVPGYRGGGNNVKPTPVRRVPKTNTKIRTLETTDIKILDSKDITEDIIKVSKRMSDDDISKFNEIFKKATFKKSATDFSYYSSTDNIIYLNPDKMRESTLYHEAGHWKDFNSKCTLEIDYGRYEYVVDKQGNFTGERKWISNKRIVKDDATFSEYVTHYWDMDNIGETKTAMQRDTENFINKTGISGKYGPDRTAEDIKRDGEAIDEYLKQKGVSSSDPEISHLSDFLSAMSFDSSLGSLKDGGHDYTYWASSTSNRITEITAGYNYLRALGRTDLIDIEKELAPELMKLIIEGWKKIW